MRMPAPLLMAVLSASFVRLSVAHQQPPTLKAEKSQTAESSAPTQKRPPQIAGRVIHDDTLVTLDFPGGTIESYAGAIRKAARRARQHLLRFVGHREFRVFSWALHAVSRAGVS